MSFSPETTRGKILKPEFKRQWIDALRSGEYQQTRGRLKRVHEEGTISYCCLGVAQKLIGRRSISPYTLGDTAAYQITQPGKGDIFQSVGQLFLTDMNDKKEMSFDEIADWIEEHL